MPKKGEVSPNRKRQEQYEMMGQGLTYKVFADRWRKRMKREEERKDRMETKMIEVTPPIEPTVPEKKKFQTPFRFDTILQLFIRFLMVGLLTSHRVPMLTVNTPVTNTVIVKAKEKVVYKSPVKKVKKPVTCAI